MEQLDRILVIFDEKQATQSALFRAIELARLTSASIHIVSTLYTTLNFINGDIVVETEQLLRERLIDRRDHEIHEYISSLDTESLTITKEILWTPFPHEEISHICTEGNYDLLIKTASVHSRLEGIFHTPLDWHILRECPCPVLLVTEETWPKGSTILASIDAISTDPEHLQLNQKILEHAGYMGDLLDDTVHAATACPPLPVLVDLEYTTVDPKEYMKQMKAAAFERSKEILKDTFLPGDNMHILGGIPEQAIPEFAEEIGSRMIVIGTVSRHGIKGYLMGNTAEQLLFHMDCDILAIKPDKASENS